MPEAQKDAAQAAVDAAGSIDRARPEGWKRDEWRTWCRANHIAVTKATQTAPGKVQWGHGPAELVRPATTEDTELVVFCSDQHFPYHDPAVIESSLRLIRKLKPHRVVLNGDINDFFQLSRFNVAREREDLLQEEIDAGVEYRRQVRAAAPDAVIDENEGNHCNRIRSYVAAKAGALKTLRALQPEALFEHDALEIDWHPGAGFRLRAHYLVKHGTMVRSQAGASAKAEYELAGISGISGHTHRLAPYRREGYVKREWREQGCMCRLDPDYVVGAVNWCQGLVVGEFSTRSDAFVTHEVEFVDGKLRFGGRAY